MRRPVCAVLCSLLILSTGCRRQDPASYLPQAIGFSCRFAADYGDMRVTGELRRVTAGSLAIAFSSPETLAGVSAEWSGDQVKLSRGTLSWSVPADTVPQAALGKSILSALDSVVYGTAEGKPDSNGRIVTTGEADGETFTLYSDAENGALLSLDVPGRSLSATFSEFVKTQ